MTRMIGILEPMCEKEQVHEIGATEEMTFDVETKSVEYPLYPSS